MASSPRVLPPSWQARKDSFIPKRAAPRSVGPHCETWAMGVARPKGASRPCPYATAQQTATFWPACSARNKGDLLPELMPFLSFQPSCQIPPPQTYPCGFELF